MQSQGQLQLEVNAVPGRHRIFRRLLDAEHCGLPVSQPLDGHQLRVETAQGRREEAHPPPANLHGQLVASFAAAVLEGRNPIVTGEEGRAVNEVMDRAYRAAGRV